MKAHTLMLFILAPWYCMGQMVISQPTKIAATNSAQMTVSLSGNFLNQTSYTFEALHLTLSLVGDGQTIQGNVTPDSLLLNGGAVSIGGNLTVTSSIEFNSGIATVQSPFIFLYTGTGAGITVDETPGDSYVDGIFYQKGSGDRKFPVGTSVNYAPLEFADLDEGEEPVGVQAHDGLPGGMIEDDVKITKILPTNYWEIFISDPAKINSQVRLPLPLPGEILEGEQAIVVQQVDGRAVSLGTYPSESFVISAGNVTSNIIALAATTEVDITIHELITPHGSFEKNDELEISNIEAFAYNKVIFLDRYGVSLKQWENYTKGTDKDFFKKLGPGNYIVIVEYGESRDSTQRKSQMVTVLRTK
jgi:hypothetical protein